MAKLIDFTSYKLDPAKVTEFRELIESEIKRANVELVEWQYLIPELGEGGSCSLFGQLQEAPFKLSEFVEPNDANKRSLAALRSIVKFVEQQN